MALNAYLTVVGQKQGQIVGSVTQKGREKSILVHAFESQITSPRDAASGLATGKRQHQPIRILKEIDKSSPLLWNALVSNENLTSCVLKFFTTGLAPAAGAGVEVQSYTVTLTNANISSMRQTMMENEIAGNAGLPLLEEVMMTYQKIQWAWNDGGITAMDDWQAGIV